MYAMLMQAMRAQKRLDGDIKVKSSSPRKSVIALEVVAYDRNQQAKETPNRRTACEVPQAYLLQLFMKGNLPLYAPGGCQPNSEQPEMTPILLASRQGRGRSHCSCFRESSTERFDSRGSRPAQLKFRFHGRRESSRQCNDASENSGGGHCFGNRCRSQDNFSSRNRWKCLGGVYGDWRIKGHGSRRSIRGTTLKVASCLRCTSLLYSLNAGTSPLIIHLAIALAEQAVELRDGGRSFQSGGMDLGR
jgi:hypothetical protein